MIHSTILHIFMIVHKKSLFLLKIHYTILLITIEIIRFIILSIYKYIDKMIDSKVFNFL